MPKRFSEETRMLRYLQETAADLHIGRRNSFAERATERSEPFPGFSEKAVTLVEGRPD